MLIKKSTCIWITFILMALTIFSLVALLITRFTLGNCSTFPKVYWLAEGERCPEREGYPNSTCQAYEKCTTLKNLTQHLIVCGFDIYANERVCCPDDRKLPVDYVSTSSITTQAQPQESPSTPATIPVSPFPHVATFAYLKPVTLDDIVYRCTAIIVAPNKVLASSKCSGSKLIERPNRVLVGVVDPRKYADSRLEFEIRRLGEWGSNLTLFGLHTQLVESELGIGKILATICNEGDLEGEPKLYAVGFTQNGGYNCALFKSRLESCSSKYNSRANQTQLCVVPHTEISFRSQMDDCTECLTGSSSVLHVERDDGSLCVAGIATPSNKECVANGNNQLYYTLIVGDADRFIDR